MPEGVPSANWSIKEEIRDYWSIRAQTFDQSRGHKIEDRCEAPEWKSLLSAALGPLHGRKVLDVACGTGEISRMLLDLGAEVTGVDFAEPMLERARAKHAGRNWQGRLADAETLWGESPESYDAVVTRHLVWTLVDPPSAFAAWHRVLKPSGRLLVIDGDWASSPLRTRLMRWLAERLSRHSDTGHRGVDMERHRLILSQVHYHDGLTERRLRDALADAGFTTFKRHSMVGVYGRGMRTAPFAERLRLRASHRFALSAGKHA